MNQQIVSFDHWRANYNTWTFAQHQTYNAELAVRYPDQASFDLDACERFLEERQPGSVVELGGWDGKLATHMLGLFPGIETWVNYDITPNVPQVCDDSRYERVVLDDWPWKRKAAGDCLVASHVFEHMRMHEIELLLRKWDIDSLYVDVPLTGATDWAGYNGTHILEVSDNDLLRRLLDAGHRTSHVEGHMIAFLDRARP